MKKIFICLGAASMIAASSISMAFSDVKETHWANKAINNMVEKSIISGYTDGTFRPSRNISKIESLILLSKIAGVNKYTEEATKYEITYTADLNAYNTAYKKQVAYLLGTGVLEKSDLPVLLADDKINSPIMREEMAVLITKILGKEEEVLKKSFFILPFSDASSITASAKPYVEFVYNNGIMKGVTEDTFSPKTYVTRAQAAIILDDIIDEVNIVPKVTTPDTSTDNSNQTADTTNVTLTLTKGTITAIDTVLGTIEIDGDIYEYDESTLFYVSGKQADEYDVSEDMDIIQATVKKGKLTSLNLDKDEIEIDEISGDIFGEIISLNISSDKILTLKVGKDERSYYLTSTTKYYIDDEKVTLYDFEIGDEVTITVNKGTVTKMIYGELKEELEESDAYKIGTITSVDTSNKKIKIKDRNNDTLTIYLASSYKIIDSDGAGTLKISKLSKGDEIIAIGKKSGSKFTASVIVLYYE